MTTTSIETHSTDEFVRYWLNLFQHSAIENVAGESIQGESILSLEKLWTLMDQVWDNMGCSNTKLDSDKISAYYQHPVWTLNGFFIEHHEPSLQHRYAIANWIAKNDITTVLDFGGGFGSLARIVSSKDENIAISIYEPYPSKTAQALCENYPSVNFVSEIQLEYDCLVSTDVLEHVPDPLQLLAKMIDSVRVNGHLVIANHFFPSIKCHLPSTFHLRYSFDNFAALMGLQKVCTLEDNQASVYQKVNSHNLDWPKIRYREKISKRLFPVKEIYYTKVRPIAKRWNVL